jgi:hypothetical protein
MIKIQLPILWRLDLFGHNLHGNEMFLVTNLVVIETFPLPILWQLKTFHRNHGATNHFLSHHTYGNQKLSFWMLVIWWMVDWSPPLIWQQNLLLFGNKKNRPCNFSSYFYLQRVGLVLFNKQPFPNTLGGREGWNLYLCLNFGSSYYFCNWCWISIIALKVEFGFIIKYFNYVNQAYYFCVLMEGKKNVWNPWYLTLEDKRTKVEYKFYGNVISYHKDKMFFHLGYWYDGNGWIWVTMCWVKTHLKRHVSGKKCIFWGVYFGGSFSLISSNISINI